jgi:hypothetical protein
MGGPYGKVSRSMSLIKSYGFTPDRIFAIDDDPVIDITMAAMLGLGLIVWLDENKERREKATTGLYRYPGKYPIVIPEAKNNMQVITTYADKLKRSVVMAETKTPFEIYQLNLEFERMKSYLKLCKTDEKELRTHMRDFITSGGKVVNIGNPFIATRLSGVDDLFSELRIGLRIGDEPKNLIKIASDICSHLEQNPELQLTEDYMEELSQMLHKPF